MIYGALGYPSLTRLTWLRQAVTAAQAGQPDTFALYETTDRRLVCLGHRRPVSTEALVCNGADDGAALSPGLDLRTAETLRASLGGPTTSFALAAYNGRTVFLAATDRPLYYLAVDDGRSLYFASEEAVLAPLTAFGIRPAALAPYSVLDLTTHEQALLRRPYVRRALVVGTPALASGPVAATLDARGFLVERLFVAGRDDDEDEGGRLAFPLPLDDDTPTLVVDGPSTDLLAVLAQAVPYALALDCHALALGRPDHEAGRARLEEVSRRLHVLLPYLIPTGYQLDVLTPWNQDGGTSADA